MYIQQVEVSPALYKLFENLYNSSQHGSLHIQIYCQRLLVLNRIYLETSSLRSPSSGTKYHPSICSRSSEHHFLMYYEYEKQQDKECKKELLTIQKELKRLRNLPTWEKVDFFKDWLKSILEIDEVEKTKKPTETTISHLAETNAYLTRK